MVTPPHSTSTQLSPSASPKCEDDDDGGEGDNGKDGEDGEGDDDDEGNKDGGHPFIHLFIHSFIHSFNHLEAARWVLMAAVVPARAAAGCRPTSCLRRLCQPAGGGHVLSLPTQCR